MANDLPRAFCFPPAGGTPRRDRVGPQHGHLGDLERALKSRYDLRPSPDGFHGDPGARTTSRQRPADGRQPDDQASDSRGRCSSGTKILKSTNRRMSA
jgi:hypothetical protein